MYCVCKLCTLFFYSQCLCKAAFGKIDAIHRVVKFCNIYWLLTFVSVVTFTSNAFYICSNVVFAVESNVIMCHVCNVTSQVENLIENRFLSKLLEEESDLGLDEESKEAEEEKKCTSCHDNNVATSWCVECEEFICLNCVMVIISCLLNTNMYSYTYYIS